MQVLCAVTDLFSRHCITYNMSAHNLKMMLLCKSEKRFVRFSCELRWNINCTIIKPVYVYRFKVMCVAMFTSVALSSDRYMDHYMMLCLLSVWVNTCITFTHNNRQDILQSI